MIIVHKWDWKSRKNHKQMMKCYNSLCVYYSDFGMYMVGFWL